MCMYSSITSSGRWENNIPTGDKIRIFAISFISQTINRIPIFLESFLSNPIFTDKNWYRHRQVQKTGNHSWTGNFLLQTILETGWEALSKELFRRLSSSDILMEISVVQRHNKI